MTENEAKEYIRSRICNEKGIQRFCRDNCMYGEGQCAFQMAIQALEEIQQYREIGTVEEILNTFNTQQLKIASRHNELEEYRAIGTIEEFKALKEKNEPKKMKTNKYQIGDRVVYVGDDYYVGDKYKLKGRIGTIIRLAEKGGKEYDQVKFDVPLDIDEDGFEYRDYFCFAENLQKLD